MASVRTGSIATGEFTVATSSFSIARPSGLEDNDVAYVSICTAAQPDVSAVPSGWSQVGTTMSPTGGRHWVYRKVLTDVSVEPSTYTWTLDAVNKGTIDFVPIQNADVVSPEDVVGTGQTGTSTTPTALGVTTTQANTLLVAFAHVADAIVTFTPPSGMTEATDHSMTSTNFVSSSVAYVAQAGAGASGNKSFTIGSSEDWSAIMVAVAPGTAQTIPDGIVWTHSQSADFTAPNTNTSTIRAGDFASANGTVTIDTNANTIDLGPGLDTHEARQSGNSFDLDTLNVKVDTSQVNSSFWVTGNSVRFQVFDNTTPTADSIRFELTGTGGSPTTLEVYDDTGLNTSVAYNATTHAFWRFRFNGSQILFEVGEDGATWNQLGTSFTPGVFDELNVERIDLQFNNFVNALSIGTLLITNINTPLSGTEVDVTHNNGLVLTSSQVFTVVVDVTDEGIVLSDAVSSSFTSGGTSLDETISDGLVLTDTNAYTADVDDVQTEGLVLTDSLGEGFDWIDTITEGLVLADTVFGSFVANNYVDAILTDDFAIADTIVAEFSGSDQEVAVSDTFDLADTLAAVWTPQSGMVSYAVMSYQIYKRGANASLEFAVRMAGGLPVPLYGLVSAKVYVHDLDGTTIIDGKMLDVLSKRSGILSGTVALTGLTAGKRYSVSIVLDWGERTDVVGVDGSLIRIEPRTRV